jgi:hypothetical protein
MYTREGDAAQLEHDRDSSLDLNMMGTLLAKLSPDPSSDDFATPPVACTPMCLDQATWTRLLRELPTLDDINIAARQRGDESLGVQIPGVDVAGNQGSVSTRTSFGKEKFKAVPHVVLSDTEVASEEDNVPL